jgi:hypothetical protein
MSDALLIQIDAYLQSGRIEEARALIKDHFVNVGVDQETADFDQQLLDMECS